VALQQRSCQHEIATNSVRCDTHLLFLRNAFTLSLPPLCMALALRIALRQAPSQLAMLSEGCHRCSQ
jgi:hypothetical protein